MDSFKVIISPKAYEQLEKYVSYIQNTLFNDVAAKRVWEDAIDTADHLASVAGSLAPCRHPKLKKLGYHSIFFLRHSYVMLYRIDGNIAYVEAIYHQLQDYENTFLRDK